jgi:peptide/nickel transport system substrate-binding protein
MKSTNGVREHLSQPAVHRRSIRRRTWVASALALSIGIAACGGDDEPEATPTTAGEESPATTATTDDTATTVADDAAEDTATTVTGETSDTSEPTATTAAAEPTATTEAAAPSDVDPTGVMRIGTSLVIPAGIHLDPTKSAVNPDRLWMELAFGTLLRWTETGSIEPFMAESFEIVDPQTLKLTLREGVTFTDGAPYDAETVKAGLLRTLNEASEVTIPSQSVAFKAISDITVDDPLNLTITLSEPQVGELAAALADREGAIVSPAQVASAPDLIDSSPIGAGPYIVDEFVDGQRVVLSKNPDFFDSDSWLLGGVEFLNIVDGASIVNGLQSDVIDLSFGVPVVDSERLTDARFTVESKPNDRSYVLLNLCTGKAPLDDADIRKAMQLAIDRDTFIQLIYGGNARPAYTLWPPDHVNYNPDVEELIAHDPDAARELLGGQTVDVDLVIIGAVAGSDVMAEVLQSQLNAVGFNANIITTQDPVAEWITPQLPGALLVPGSRSGVDKYVRTFEAGQVQALCGTSRPEIVETVTPAAQLVPGDESAAALYQEADMMIAEGGYVIPLAWSPNIAAWNSEKLGGEFLFSGTSSTPLLDTFYVKN